MERLIKSRLRVQQFGEVFTPSWMVKKMLDLPDIQDALRDPNSKFLEPCCGEGAFLTEILRRKLSFHPAFPWHILRSLYGIEIQLDNLAYARKNLALIFAAHCHIDFEDERIWEILSRNIFHGDVLKFKISVTNLFGEEFVLSKKPLADALKAHFNMSDDEIKSMVIISNPRYQDLSANTSDKPIYNKIMEVYHKTSDRVMVIHPARFLADAGKTSKDFNDKILSDEHVKVVFYEPDSKKVFPGVDIRGGVAVTYRDANKIFGAIGIHIPFDELKSIYQKVVGRNDFRPFSEIVYGRFNYRLTEKFFAENPNAPSEIIKHQNDFMTSNVFQRSADYFFDEKPDDGHEYIQILGRDKNERAFKWIRRDYISTKNGNVNFDKYKVFIPQANGSGRLGEKVSTMLVGLPLVGSTQTFLTLGAFDNEAEATACMKYVKTKFARALLGILKVTQHNTSEKWRFVPLQDFTAGSDIDWSASVGEIDRQLYKKYGLDARETGFIEEKVKAME